MPQSLHSVHWSWLVEVKTIAGVRVGETLSVVEMHATWQPCLHGWLSPPSPPMPLENETSTCSEYPIELTEGSS